MCFLSKYNSKTIETIKSCRDGKKASCKMKAICLFRRPEYPSEKDLAEKHFSSAHSG